MDYKMQDIDEVEAERLIKVIEDAQKEHTEKLALKKSLSALDSQVAGSHYKSMKIQPVEYILANELGFCEGSIVKYVSRYKNKNGIEDLKKARHFLDILIEQAGLTS